MLWVYILISLWLIIGGTTFIVGDKYGDIRPISRGEYLLLLCWCSTLGIISLMCALGIWLADNKWWKEQV